MDVQQNGHKGTCTSHLSDQVKEGNREGTAGRSDADWFLTQSEGQHVSHGEAAHVTKWLCHEQQCNKPCDEEADGVKESVVTVK